MAIIRPFNAIIRNDELSPGFLDVGGATDSGFGPWVLKGSFAANQVLELWFKMPPGSLPTGTGKLDFIAIANAATGTIDLNPKWKSFAIEEDINNPTLNAEGTTTVTWSTGDEWDLKQSKIALDADTLVAGELVIMHLTFETTSSLAVDAGFDASIIFE